MAGDVLAAPPGHRGTKLLLAVRDFVRHRPALAFVLVLALVFATTLGAFAAFGVWPGTTVYGGGLYTASLAADSTGTFYVAFDNVSLVYATNAGGAWTSRILDPNRNYGPPSIAVDSKGGVHILEDAFNPSNPPGDLGRLRYWTNAGGAWSETTITDAGAAPSMSVDAAGAAHIAYVWSNETSSGPRWTDFHYVTNAGGTWTDRVVHSLPGDATSDSFTAIATKESGEVAISFSGAIYFLGLLTNASGAWNYTWLTDVPSSGGVYGSVPVAIDSLGRAHLVYTSYDPLTNITALVHTTVSNGHTDVEPVVRVGGAISCSMLLDGEDHLHVAYIDSRNPAVTYLTDAHGAWSAALVDLHAATYWTPSIALLPSGDAAILYEAVRPPPWGSQEGQTFLRLAGENVASWNAADFVGGAALYLTVEFVVVAAAVRAVSNPRNWRTPGR